VQHARFVSHSNQLNCFVSGDLFDDQDHTGHGTHVAGIIASQGSPGFTNYLGVAYGLSNDLQHQGRMCDDF
jgi:subtilisin family serine protease